MEEPICEMLYPSPRRKNWESEQGVFVNNNGHWTATFNFDQIRSGYIEREDESYNLQVENWI